MPKFLVRVPYCVWVNVKVEAGDTEEAERLAYSMAGLSAYCGNGGSDKLIGVSDSNASVEACDVPLDFEIIHTEVEEM